MNENKENKINKTELQLKQIHYEKKILPKCLKAKTLKIIINIIILTTIYIYIY